MRSLAAILIVIPVIGGGITVCRALTPDNVPLAVIGQLTAKLDQAQELVDLERERAPSRLAGAEAQLRLARQGEVVNAGDPIVTIMDLDDIWVRAELEESYLGRVRVGEKLMVEVASGEEMEGEVIFVTPEAGFATQRDVSRVKRDLRTFGIKVAVPNLDRRLHAGMTAYVFLPNEDFGPARAAAPRESPSTMRQQDERLEKVVSSLERVTAALEHLVTDSQPRQLAPLEGTEEKGILAARERRKRDEEPSPAGIPASIVNQERSGNPVSSVEAPAARLETTGSESPNPGSDSAATLDSGMGSEPQASPHLVLQATVFIGEVPVAMVNGQPVFEGDRVEGVTVTRIRDGVLEMEFEDKRFLLRS